MGSRLSYPEVDLSERVAIVTGGNSGIGYETAKGLAAMGAHTIIACRSRERAEEAIERLKQEVSAESPGKEVKVEFMALDLASFQSTKEFTVAFREKNLPLHILVNNAGVAWIPFSKTADGYEVQLQVNHLSHFLVTLELLPILLESASQTGDSRIVIVSSSLYTLSSWEPENLNGEQGYNRLKFYPKSKLYNIMTAYALQRRLNDVGITVSTVHPGSVNTNIDRGVHDNQLFKFVAFCVMKVARSPQDGAATTLNCAVNPELNSQQCYYYTNCAATSTNTTSRNEQYQEDLWRRSIDMVKDYLSPEILATYGSPCSPQAQAEVVSQEAGSEDVAPQPELQETGHKIEAPDVEEKTHVDL